MLLAVTTKGSISKHTVRMIKISSVFVDFDETITKHDTLEPLLLKSALSALPLKEQEQRVTIWRSLVDQYMEELIPWRTRSFGELSNDVCRNAEYHNKHI
jgi:hypothetical protein